MAGFCRLGQSRSTQRCRAGRPAGGSPHRIRVRAAVGRPLTTAFAGAAAVGDYAAAQGYLEDNAMLYGVWKDQHDDFQEEIAGYQIVSRETVGQTTTAIVRFDLANKYATCITLTLNERTQRIWMDRGYSECAEQ